MSCSIEQWRYCQLPIKKGAKKDDILSGLLKVIKLYRARGLEVVQVHGDNEFECVREELNPILLNISAAD